MQTKISFPTARDVGRSDPLHPLGDGVREGSHPLALSRGCSVGGFGFRRDRRAARLEQRRMFFRAYSIEGFDLRRCRGAVLVGTLVPDDAGVGRSTPLHPLGDGVREGCDPHALSRGLFERCFGFRENARGVPLGTEAGESHIFTSRFRRSFSLQRNAFTALFRQTGCKRCLHPAAPKNGEFMKLID